MDQHVALLEVVEAYNLSMESHIQLHLLYH